MKISRRVFLTLSGATIIAAAMRVDLASAAFVPDTVAGRALRATPVLAHPDTDLPPIRWLWPDSTVRIDGRAGGWFRVPDGVVRQVDVQPMLPYDLCSVHIPTRLPSWITVCAPVASLRAWIAPTAPVVNRVGNGGVLCAVDSLHDDRGNLWYGVSHSPDASPLGWTPALRWTEAAVPSPEHSDDSRWLLLDTQRMEVVTLEDTRPVLRAPAVVPPDARPGRWSLLGRSPAAEPTGITCGAAWMLASQGPVLYGAHWHHDFGREGSESAWEVSPWVASWLYGWLPEGAALVVR